MKEHLIVMDGRVVSLVILFVLGFVSVPLLPAQESSSYGAVSGDTAISLRQAAGSVVALQEQPTAMPLSMREALNLGLANNLGILLRKEGVQSARGQEWVELSKLLPNLAATGALHRQKENFAVSGISLPNTPSVVGPFDYYDTRLTLRQRIFDLEAIDRSRAAAHQVTAAELSEQDARELVVVAVGTAYLQALAAQVRVETVTAQVVTARTILDRAVAMHRQGVSPGIDELRARVELLTRNQQLIVAENDLAKQKLALIRLIGIPVGQEIELTDRYPFEPAPPAAVEDLIAAALKSRRDFRQMETLVKAAETSRQAAKAQRLPSVILNADYGITGLNPSSMYETYHIVGLVTFPLFEGGRIHGDVLRAEALARQRSDELADLRSQIEYDVRTALLDVDAAARQVEVATTTVQLSELALSQAQERFYAGINDNLEVVQAQQSVAAAHEMLISSRYRHNVAKLFLARATGTAEAGISNGGR